MKKIIFVGAMAMIAIFIVKISALAQIARNPESITNWYIQDFQADFYLNADSTMRVVEKISADCGNLPDKHGIFRVLPYEQKIQNGSTYKTPIQLNSITDFKGKNYSFETSRDIFNKTISWKIGDAGITVTGKNYYQVEYTVANIIRPIGENGEIAPSHEFYWNLLGAYWDLEIDNFKAIIHFPKSINNQNTQIDYYAGFYGEKNKNLTSYRWQGNDLIFESATPLPKQSGITASVVFPNNIFTLYQFSFWELYANYLFYLIPILVFWYGFSQWAKFGKDPRLNRAITPEYSPPDDFTPLEMSSLLSSYGSARDSAISATIIKLATEGHITIKNIGSKWVKNFEIARLRLGGEIKNPQEKALLDAIMLGKENITTRELKKRTDLYETMKAVKDAIKQGLKERGYAEDEMIDVVKKRGAVAKVNKSCSLAILAVGFVALIFIGFAYISDSAGMASVISFIIIFIFLLLMPRRTQKGAETLWRVKGFKMYMETAEKYRQRFYEKENIFEKLLPYAMVFGIATLWIKQMKDIYGDRYFDTYHPLWLVDSSGSGFDVGSFSSELNSISQAISSGAGTSSGAGGGGSSGGGGGGGGGGGW